MNRDFSEFRELLKKDPPVFLWSSDGPVLSKNEGWWADFVNFANEHARTNTSGVIKGENLVIIHPFFEEFRKDKPLPRSKAAVTIEELLRDPRLAGYGRVLFESYQHYGLRTYQWVDEGLVDKVIFAYGGRGIPLNFQDLGGFSASRANYFCGVYGRQAVTTAAYAVMLYAPILSIRPVNDAIVYGRWSLNPFVLLDVFNSAFRGVSSIDLLSPKSA